MRPSHVGTVAARGSVLASTQSVDPHTPPIPQRVNIPSLLSGVVLAKQPSPVEQTKRQRISGRSKNSNAAMLLSASPLMAACRPRDVPTRLSSQARRSSEAIPAGGRIGRSPLGKYNEEPGDTNWPHRTRLSVVKPPIDTGNHAAALPFRAGSCRLCRCSCRRRLRRRILRSVPILIAAQANWTHVGSLETLARHG